MILYHGGITAIENPRIIPNSIGRDFGPAFYTTDIKEQAQRWTLRRMQTAVRSEDKTVKAVVSVFEYDDILACQRLSLKNFPDVSLDWLDLVIACRSDRDCSHGYDIVSGKIANDNVGETVAYVLAGVMRKEDALVRLKFQKINHQIAFCTNRALTFLKYKSHFILEVPHD
ncbi:MAG: DUF3990 domain-containing protein [Planctomycetia bacterium]|nr:DUF3990 domain-containing protein [Planctomycetia bacterium]